MLVKGIELVLLQQNLRVFCPEDRDHAARLLHRPGPIAGIVLRHGSSRKVLEPVAIIFHGIFSRETLGGDARQHRLC